MGAPSERAEAAAELEALGFRAAWIPGAFGGDLLGDVRVLLDATREMSVATGILNIYQHEPSEVGTWWAAQSAALKSRVLLGLGVSHGSFIGAAYGPPLQAMGGFLDKLDAAGVSPEARCLAALGPKMLDLSRLRTAGAHPYLVQPEHTAQARERLGPDALLAPEQGVVLESDPVKAREIARKGLGIYMTLPNYVNSWCRLGFSEADVTGPSDRLVDALFAYGMEQISARVKAHLDAGADHVCLQVIRGAVGEYEDLPRGAWRELAGLL
jgi:probable F420-dependent oxidoreductase